VSSSHRKKTTLHNAEIFATRCVIERSQKEVKNNTPVAMNVRKLTPEIGAEISHFNVLTATPKDIRALKAVLQESHVVFLPNQPATMTVEQHIAFGRHFGPLQSHPNLTKAVVNQHPEIFELKASQGGVANEWHTDLTFQQKPALMSILRMVQCPETGGDTMWASLGAAYDALSKPMQDMVENLTALHDASPHNKPEVTAVHPIVRVHPTTGRKCLYVSEHFTRRIVELSPRESKVLLEFLTRHIQDPRFNVRYHWTPSTIAIWDNTCTQHCVLNNFVGERHIQRVTIAGDTVEPSNNKLPVYAPCVSDGGALSRHDRQLFLHFKQEHKMPKIAGGGTSRL
jgi:taurine dioxygenase